MKCIDIIKNIENWAPKEIAWQKDNDYGLRSRVELAIQRYKRIIDSCMKARASSQQKTEAWVSASALNRMTNLGMPVSVKI